MATIEDIIQKRKKIWQERHDIEYDKAFVSAAARKILSEHSLREKIREKPWLLVEVAFTIVNKKRETVPFFFNEVQTDFLSQIEKHGTARPYFILKGRQQGFTSLVTAVQLAFAITRRNFSGFTMADRADNTRAIFNDKARMVLERLPRELRPSERFNSIGELFFDKLGSSWRAATATENVGRSRTLNFVHFSEVGFYECDLSSLQAGVGEAVAAGAYQIYESTANGFNSAKDLWDSGSCVNLFYEWWRTQEYRSTEYEYLNTSDAWLIERMRLLYERGCDREQVTWYAKKYAGYIDKALIRQEYPIIPEEAFLSSGECVFDKEAIHGQLTRLSSMPLPRKGYFEYKKECVPIRTESGEVLDTEWKIRDISFRESEDGYVLLYEEPRVKWGSEGEVVAKAPYVIGGDTAGSGEDYFTAKVICNLDGRCAASLRKQRMDEDLYAEQLYCLGRYYNDALIAVETNYSRVPVRILEQKYAYPRLYRRERVDKTIGETLLVCGFETTAKTKPIIIGELAAILREDVTVERDVETLREMLTFVKKENGKQEAALGKHDDMVMATAIAHFAAHQMTRTYMAVKDETDGFIRSNFHQTEESGSVFMDWDDF